MGNAGSKLTRSAPYFPVLDLEGAVHHYTTVLGFGLDYAGGEPMEFAILSRDGLAIMLRRVREVVIAPNEAQGGTWDAFFWVEGLQALFNEMESAGATVVYPPTLQAAYGMTEFAVRDPAGHVLGFGEPV